MQVPDALAAVDLRDLQLDARRVARVFDLRQDRELDLRAGDDFDRRRACAPPVPSDRFCSPPLAIVPEASSPGALPPTTEIDHAMPSPQTSWPSVTLPVTRTLAR